MDVPPSCAAGSKGGQPNVESTLARHRQAKRGSRGKVLGNGHMATVVLEHNLVFTCSQLRHSHDAPLISLHYTTFGEHWLPSNPMLASV